MDYYLAHFESSLKLLKRININFHCSIFTQLDMCLSKISKLEKHSNMIKHMCLFQVQYTKMYTDWSRAVPSSPGPNHPSKDLYSICGDVSSSINRFLPNRRTVQHNLHRCLADGNMELQRRQRISECFLQLLLMFNRWQKPVFLWLI